MKTKNINRANTSEKVVRFCKDLDNSIGATLYNLRVQHGISMSILAENLGVSTQQLRKYEIGINKLSLGKLLIICKYFKCDIDYFIKNVANTLEVEPINYHNGIRDVNKLSNIQKTLINKLITELTKEII